MIDGPKEAASEAPAEAGLASLLQRLGAVRFTRAADSTLRFLEIEGPCAERMGLSQATLTGDAYSFWSRVDSRDRQRVLAVLEEALRKGSVYRVLYRIEAGDGAARRVREEGAARFDEHGEVDGLEGVILDGAGESASALDEGAVEDLFVDEERFRKLAEHSGALIAEISAGPKISFASLRLCRDLGVSEADLEGRDPTSLIHPEDREDVLATVREATQTGAAPEVLCRLQRAGGEWMWVELKGCVYTSESGERRGVVTGHSVENRIQVEEAFLAQRLAEARVGRLSRRFIELGSAGLDEAIHEAVEAAAEMGGADRCYLAAFPSEHAKQTRTWTWQREGLGEWQLELDRDGAQTHHWLVERLVRGEVVCIPSTRELEGVGEEARRHLASHGVCSYCVIPVRSDGRLTALLGFQVLRGERDWTDQEIALLRLVAELLASALRRRDSEDALRDGEQRLQALADSAQDAICENDVSRGDILYANRRFYEMHGYTPEQARGKTCFEFMHPEDLGRTQSAHAAFQRGDLGDSLSGTLLYRGLHREGRTLWLEANGQLFRTAFGEARSAAVIRDVTEREEAQRTMECRLEHQRRIANVARDLLALGLDEMDEGIGEGLLSLLPISGADRAWLVTFDPATMSQEAWERGGEGVAAPDLAMRDVDLDLYPDARSLFEAGRELVLGTDSARAKPPERGFLAQRGATALLAIPLLSGGQVVGGIGFERVAGRPTWDEEAVALLRLGGEIFVSAVSRRRAEEALRESRGQLLQAQKMEAVGTLAGGVAHDFNNQLSVILGNARFVRGEVAGSDDLSEAMTDLERAADHCAQLTRQLLSFSRHVPAEPQATSVERVLQDVSDLTGPLLSGDIAFEALAHDALSEVWADPTQLQQVLVNLVVNARDAMPDGGSLSIRTEARQVTQPEAGQLGLAVSGDYVMFLVADSGSGMDAATLGRIFEPFFTTKEPGKGTGLGLATVYGILSESGGAVWADSSLGVGTTFRLLLPCPRHEAEAEEQTPEASPAVGGGGTLLLVDDDESVRQLMRRMLAAMGFDVLEASNGADALSVSEAHPGEIEALVSDLSMPGMGGAELGRRLLAARPGLRVLLVTGRAEDDAGPSDQQILFKPFRREELESALEALLADRDQSERT